MRIFLSTLFLCLFVHPALSAQRPNIVLILADDLGYETVGCYGGHDYGTPNLDRLASDGIRFDRAYAMPLCTNTRIQLMTGKYNVRNWTSFGILPPGETTFGHLMQKAGYKTCIAGKWQLKSYDPPDFPGAEKRRDTGVAPREAGFDEYSLWHVGHTEDKGSRYADPVIEQNGEMLKDTAGKYGPDIWTDFIGDFMRRHRDKPFFVYYSMALPHNPMNPTPDSPEWADPSKRLDDITRFQADMIRYTDKMVGKVIGQLDDLGLRENTLVLFFSDNGTNARVTSHYEDRMVRGGKGQGTELGVRVPMIVNWQGVTPRGVVSQDLIDSTDFLPTIMDAVGASDLIEEKLDGVSFAPQLHSQAGNPRDAIFIHQEPRPGWDKDRFHLIRLAIGQRFKLHEDGRLYDLANDRFEESPIYFSDDSTESRAARTGLQTVLDSMTPYPVFDPSEMPRPNPTDQYRDHAFQDQGGYVVAEAELLPVPRDGSYRFENEIIGYSGTGYFRTLRDQRTPPALGMARLVVNLASSGDWNLALRARTDHPSGSAENELWMKIGEGDWFICRVPSSGSIGKWSWIKSRVGDPGGQRTSLSFGFEEKTNEVWIAPRSANLKIDRIVLFKSDMADIALDIHTPISPFHPW